MNQFLSSVQNLLKEAYEGTDSRSWFSDSGAGAGVLATLGSVSAEAASSRLTNSGTSIAGHCNHLRWSLALSNGLMRGEQPSSDWTESWIVQSVDEPTWDILRDALQSEYELLQSNLERGFDATNPQMVTAGIALVAHAAYHLGAIRQLASVVG